jgi:hypothetical protein
MDKQMIWSIAFDNIDYHSTMCKEALEYQADAMILNATQ